MNTDRLSSNLNAQQFLASLNRLAANNNTTGVIGSGATPPSSAASTSSSSSTSTSQTRFALQPNQNLVNISSNNNNNNTTSASNNNNAAAAANLLRNLQLSPPKSKLGGVGQQNVAPQQQNYPLNQSLQSQINFLAAAQQQQQQQKANSIAQANQNTILAAATLLAASANTNTNLCQLSSLYQQQQQQVQQQQQQQQQQAAAAAAQFSQNRTFNLNNTLFVGNLHASLQEIDLINVFRPFGHIVECCKKWLHFGFVKFTTEEEACLAFATLNGFKLKGRPMRLEFQNRSKKARIKAILEQAAQEAMLAGGGGLSTQDQLLSMGNYGNLGLGGAASASTGSSNGYASSQTYGSYANSNSSSSSVNFSFLPNAQNTNTSNYYQPQHHHQNHHNQHQPQQQHHHHNPYKTYNHQHNQQHNVDLNALFSADQLLKYATGLEQIEKETTLTPEFNFDPSSTLIGNGNEMSLYDELDLKLSIDDGRYLQQHHPQYHSSSSTASSSSSSGGSTSTVASAFSRFLDIHCGGNINSNITSTGIISLKNSNSDDLVLSLAKHAISPVESPKHHHDTSSSTSMDSGCRSNSFLNDEDSAVYSMSTQATSCSSMSTHLQVPGGNRHKSLSSSSIGSSCAGSGAEDVTNEKRETSKKKMESSDYGCNTISEHLEFTCSKSSPVKSISTEEPMMPMKERLVDDDEDDDDDGVDEHECLSECDTSVDASDLPDENLSTTGSEVDEDDLTDLDLEFELAAAEEEELKHVQQVNQRVEPLLKFNQVLGEDGSVLRKRLDSGIYKSVNETASLFIEPHDVLKRMEMNEFDEYNLFPHGVMMSGSEFDDNLDSLVDDAAALLGVSKF